MLWAAGFIVILALFIWGYFFLNGAPGGKAAAKKQFIASLNQEYAGYGFQMGKVTYNFELHNYDITITFDQLPNVEYIFELDQGKAVYFGTNTATAPVPVPNSNSWMKNQNSK